MSESVSPLAIPNQLLSLLPIRHGHFQFESGHHGDTWLELDALFTNPVALRSFADDLAHRLEPYQPQIVCGPMLGGALLAQMIAETLRIEFYFTERLAANESSDVRYEIPKSLRQRLVGKGVAVVDDAINAGSAVGATLAELRSAGAQPIVVGALLLLGTTSESFLAAQEMPCEYLARLSCRLWPPTACPHCVAGVPLEVTPTSALPDLISKSVP